MGHSWSTRAPKLRDGGARIEITENDALTVCEDGDLLLIREQVVHAALRVVLDAHVARDIARMQNGQFPTQRITQLPDGSSLIILCCCACVIASALSVVQVWTSCALLLRQHGRLHVLEITVDGLALIPFSDKVANRLTHRDRSVNVMPVHACAALYAKFAIRRLKNHVANDVFRTLVAEITALGPPFGWRSFDQRDLPMALAHDHPKTQLPPYITALMKRTLSLFQKSIALVRMTSKGSAMTTTPQVDHALQQQPDHNYSPTALKTNAKAPGSIDNMASLAFIDQANVQMCRHDEHAILSACFVAAVYERAGIIAPIQQTSVEHRAITPACFWAGAAINSSSNSDDAFASEYSKLLPKDTLGHDMYLL